MTKTITTIATTDSNNFSKREYMENADYNGQKAEFFIVIGASAGGLEAIQTIVDQLPLNSNMAYIIMQHLSPDFKSMMDEILSRHTKLKVVEASDGMEVMANTIYLMPSKSNMLMTEGKLRLVKRPPPHARNYPIDEFFKSIADDQKHRCIAIILSGSGSDGSRGILTIKEQGGFVIVQNPKDAQFDGMPINAVNTGAADLILSTAEIAKQLVNLVKNLPLNAEEDPSVLLASKEAESALQQIFTLLEGSSEIDYSQYKSTTVLRRIERRMRLHGVTELEAYLPILQNDDDELNTLNKELLIGVTQFFRDAEAFNYLKNTIIPQIFNLTLKTLSIRIWTAACSTGEEAYSIAMLFDEENRKRGNTHTIKIFATDVDANAVRKAALGTYSANAVVDISSERLSRYFKEDELGFTINPQLRKQVVFATHNLLKDPPFSNCQLTVCRNLLIYFLAQGQNTALTMLQFALSKDGFLFLGNSESLGSFRKNFNPINEPLRFYQKSDEVVHLGSSIASNNKGQSKKKTPSVEQLLQHYHVKKLPQHISALEALINKLVPACIVLNLDLDVVHVYGSTDPYLKKMAKGRFSTKIADYLNDDLTVAVTTAINRAIATKKEVKYSEVDFHLPGGEQTQLKLCAIYAPPSNEGLAYVVITFEHDEPHLKTKDELKYSGPETIGEQQQRILDLELALRKNQDDLQVSIEALEATNEELQTSNEELMTSNEELQSTNEELQSVNEELYSVNSEYQQQIEEKTRTNLDIDNIIRSADIGFILLDEAMLIRRFSPIVKEHIHLIDSDIGRPFHHISHRLDYPLLMKDISDTIKNSQSFQKELITANGQSLVVKLQPYYDAFTSAKGCVISLTNISQVTSLKNRLHASYQELRSTIATGFKLSSEVCNILVVDDNELDRMAIELTLNKINYPENYNITYSGTYQEAQEYIEQNKVDVCLIDYLLDEFNGLQVAENMRNVACPPAFIMLTGHVDEELNERAISLGIYDVLDKKDITPALLQRSIRYTQRHRKTEEYLSQGYLDG